MAKNLLFSLLFSIQPFLTTPISASIESNILESRILRLNECNAPPPDSFRITSVGNSYIALAWKPAWIGATHVLTVSEKDAFGGWTPINSFPDIPGSSFTVNSLENGKEYRFRIATKCISGVPSELTAFVDGIALIIDLTLIGRTPKNPQPINCHGIEYAKYPWLGFKISGEGYSCLFEVKIYGSNSDPFGTVDRVKPESNIVASNMQFEYPSNFNPVIYDVPLTFRILKLNDSNPEKIGLVKIESIPSNTNTIDLCNVTTDIQNPWKNGYTFTPLIAFETIIIPPGGGSGGLGFGNDPILNKFTAQNPFNKYLNINAPSDFHNEDAILIRLVNINGGLVFTQIFDFQNQNVSIPMEWLPQGIYFLSIQSKEKTEVLKIVKQI